MSATLDELRTDWERLGTSDPLHAILNDPSTRGQKWKADRFFRAGEMEIDAVMRWLELRGALPRHWDSSMDFGCGVGRLTRSLARRFRQVVGVDIAASMLDAGRKLAPPGNCRFVLNTSETLSDFPDASFDFVYSSIVLQHMPGNLALGYIAEFCRVTRPGGMIVFQIPVARRVPVLDALGGLLSRLRARLALATRLRALLAGRKPEISDDGESGRILMHFVPEELILEQLQESGVKLMVSAFTNSCDPAFNGALEIHRAPRFHAHFLSRIFAVRKPDAPCTSPQLS